MTLDNIGYALYAVPIALLFGVMFYAIFDSISGSPKRRKEQ